MGWWLLGGCLGLGGLALGWLFVEKQAMRRWRRRQRQRLQQYLLAHPETGQLQVDGSFCFRRGPHVLSYLHHPEHAPPNHVVWLSVKQRVTAWDRPSHHLRRWLRVLLATWLRRLWCWQMAVALILLLVCGIGFADTERAQRARLETSVAQGLGLPRNAVRLERGGESRIEALRGAAPRQDGVARAWRAARSWLAGREISYVLHVRGQDIGYVLRRSRWSAHADVWVQHQGSWRHGLLDDRRVLWVAEPSPVAATPYDGSSYPAKSLMK